jgi:hypothetical protein
MRWLPLVFLAVLGGCRSPVRPAEGRPADEKVVTLVATAEVQGTPEPCGCNADTLGDIARVIPLLKGGLLMDAGGLLFGEFSSGAAAVQADLKAAALAKLYANADVGLGADDLAHGAAKVAPPRQAANCANPLPIVAPHVRELAGIKVGVFGVVTPARVKGKVTASDPVPAAQAAVAKLKREGAQVIVGLLGMSRTEAHDLMEKVDGISFGIAGAEVGDGMVQAEPVGKGFLVMPADQLRRVVKLELHVRGGQVALTPFGGETARTLGIDRAQRRIQTLSKQLAQWQHDPTADKAFVADREKELTSLRAEKAKLEKDRPTPPDASYFTYELVPVRTNLPRDPAVAAQLKQLAHQIGQANLAAAKDQQPPAADPGKPSYVGMDQCARCHKSEVEFWKKTVHATAWKTLVDLDKQYNYDCIGCHVTGFARPGGSVLGTVEKQKLVDVQCEVCHGPGSIHVKEDGQEEPPSLATKPAEGLCREQCHTKEHSDTFDLVPYLRDITGPGHGAKFRKQIGDGVTGHELRSKALEAVGRK